MVRTHWRDMTEESVTEARAFLSVVLMSSQTVRAGHLAWRRHIFGSARHFRMERLGDVQKRDVAGRPRKAQASASAPLCVDEVSASQRNRQPAYERRRDFLRRRDRADRPRRIVLLVLRYVKKNPESVARPG